MLRAMRKHAKYFYVLFVIVILTFMFWGVGTVDKTTTVPVATVGKDKVTVEEYWRAYERTLNLAKDVYKDKFDSEMEKKLGLKQKTLDNLIEERVVIRAAEEAGVTVTDRELEEAITHDPMFVRDGAFNRDIYLRTLELNRINPQIYESMKRRELLAMKLMRSAEQAVDLSPAEKSRIIGEEAGKEELAKALLEDKREKALRAFIEGLRRGMDVKINNQIIED